MYTHDVTSGPLAVRLRIRALQSSDYFTRSTCGVVVELNSRFLECCEGYSDWKKQSAVRVQAELGEALPRYVDGEVE